MKKYFYFAVTIYHEKYFSYVLKVSTSDNIVSRLKIPGIVHANIYPTKKEAAATVEHWNACHKANGTYLFDNPAF